MRRSSLLGKNQIVTMKNITQNAQSRHDKIENQQICDLMIKVQALDHFLDTIHQNNEESISNYAEKLGKNHQLHEKLSENMGKLGTKRKTFKSITKKNLPPVREDTHNVLFMLEIQNNSLKCREKLLKQKIQCQNLMVKRVKNQQSQTLQKQNYMRVKEINLLKQEVQQLEDIIMMKEHIKNVKKIRNNLEIFASKIEQIKDKKGSRTLSKQTYRKIAKKIKENEIFDSKNEKVKKMMHDTGHMGSKLPFSIEC